jgi:hypothetical protein
MSTVGIEPIVASDIAVRMRDHVADAQFACRCAVPHPGKREKKFA